jgi:predicted PhzF superfamily epimerase YddE/YHI9
MWIAPAARGLANQPFTGIQLGVFPDAAGIDERRMQQIANEMALPETKSEDNEKTSRRTYR